MAVNVVKYWDGSSWKSPGYFGKTRMWDGTQWRTVEVKYAGAAGTSNWNWPYGTLDLQTVTVGYYSYTDFEAGISESQSGYGGSAGGSISDGTSNIYGGAAFNGLYYSYSNVYGTAIVLDIPGYSLSNSGWTNIQIGSLTLSRESATYQTYVGPPAFTQWIWFEPGSDPFGTTIGTQVQVLFS